MTWRYAYGKTPGIRLALWVGAALCVLWTCQPPVANSQTTAEGSAGGLEPLLPVVPPRGPRSLEGLDPDQQFSTDSGRAPVASFIDSLQGNDAAVEVTVGQGKLLTLKQAIATARGTAFIAVGDPTILEFEILPNPRMIRLIGVRAGVTDMSITTSDEETYSIEVHVVYDLSLLRAQLRQIFPSAELRLAQLREHVVVEGQARSPTQVAQIIQTIERYVQSAQVPVSSQEQQAALGDLPGGGPNVPNPIRGEPETADSTPEEAAGPGALSGADVGGRPSVQASFSQPQVINLIRVPGVQQVLLKVRIAELNRTALREVGADVLAVDPNTGNIMGTQIGGAVVDAVSTAGMGGLMGTAANELSGSGTAFGIFPSSDFDVIIRLLRQNSLLRVLAEPNLIAMTGHQANFLVGGEFPVPIPQQGTDVNTVQYREFGVRLDFVPIVLDDDRVRLSVTPEVSTVDESLGTTLVVGGDPVPGLNTRRAHTTVELRQGQTLAMAGLLQVVLDAQTNRIPGLGDLPILGPLFSNTSHKRTEKELLVLVTPYLVQPMDEHQVPPMPGDCVEDPTDTELYFGNRIEGRTGLRHRSTTQYGIDSWHLIEYHRSHMHGPIGYGP